MKRVLCVITALVVCLAMACPVLAAEDDFVPSIPYKGAPDIVPVEDPNGDPAIGVVVKGDEPIDYIDEPCLVVTPVSEAETSELIPDDAAELLLELYEGLSSGEDELPYEKFDENLKDNEMVIRDMFDVSLLCEEHPPIVAEEGVYLELIFDLGVGPDEKVYCMEYTDGDWVPCVSLKNNGDGTVTVRLEDVGPVVFSVVQKTPAATTGDTMDFTLWIAVMVLSAAALVVLLVAPKLRKNCR